MVPRTGFRALPVLTAMIALGPLVAHAFGDAADQMCNHPEKFIEGKPSSYTEMNPQSPDYKKSGVIGQPCNDGAMASGYCTTIIKAGPGTGCLATKCGGTDCKQAKPGEQPQQPPQEQKPPGDQQEQQDQGKGGQMPEMPKPQGGGGGGGDKQPQQQSQQSSSENCAFSSAFGIPCQKPVSSQLEASDQARSDAGTRLSGLGNENTSATQGKTGSPTSQTVFDRLGAGISDLWNKLSGTAPAVSNGDVQDGTPLPSMAPNATFAPPPAYSGTFTLEQKQGWWGQTVAWFQGLFK